MSNIEFSVIVLTYNANLCAILLTLKSLVKQQFDKFEIIIADDNSVNNYYSQIQDYFLHNNFTRYKFLESNINVGTVNNYIKGIQAAEGKYIKPIGAGDFLYNDKTLKTIYNHLEVSKSNFGFGLMQAYYINDEFNILKNNFRAPIYINPYLNNDLKKISKNIIYNGDYISGATLFGTKEFLLKYLTQISNTVKYTEDIIQILVLMNNEDISFINEKIIFYEVGAGISTKKVVSKQKKLINYDHEAFWQYLSLQYKSKKILSRCNFQIKLINESNRIKKSLLILLTNKAEFLNNQIRKTWRRNRKEKVSEGFLKNEQFIYEIVNIVNCNNGK